MCNYHATADFDALQVPLNATLRHWKALGIELAGFPCLMLTLAVQNYRTVWETKLKPQTKLLVILVFLSKS